MTAALPEIRWIPLGEVLVHSGLVSAQQLTYALSVQEETGKRLGEIVVELGFATERAIALALARQYNLDFIDLDETPIEREAVPLLPERLARRYQALPIRLLGEGQLLLAVVDPANLRAADDLRLAIGVTVQLAVADASQIGRATARAYRRSLELAKPEHDEAAPLEDIRDIASSVPTISLVNSLLTTAIEENASDIHFEPGREAMAVRIRVDGVMRDVSTIPRHAQAAVISRLKIMGGLDIAERRLPQDGRLSAHFGGEPIDLRIAVVPTVYGESVALRFVSRRGKRPTLADLAMTPEASEIFLAALSQPYGAIIVCGPTGSGKTTTLYGALDYLANRERVIMTIEDPVEHRVDGTAQVEVEPKAGLTFATGLRTILRSDPDVLLVGEIRDEETASIAAHAAMTGHLVLTSLHAHNAAGAIVRLRDMGVAPGVLASALNCIVAQRLARRLCAECRQPHVADAADLGGRFEGHQQVTLYRAGGCVACSGTGYRGRVALREVLPVQGEIRRLVERSTDEIFAAAVRNGMQTLREDGIRLCLQGECSLEEIRRVTGDRLV